MFQDSSRYRELRKELSELQSSPVPNVAAIDRCIDELAKEQLRLKANDGQPGSNPIEELRRRDVDGVVDDPEGAI